MKGTKDRDNTAPPFPAQDRRIDPDAPETIATLRRHAARLLAAADVEQAGLDARILVGHGLGLDRERLLIDADRPVTAAERARVEALIARRLTREPVSRILGRREFWSLDFALTPETLDPRPDSETVIEAALAAAPKGPLEILDLGTGSGCLLLALLSERRDARGLGLDASPGAIAAAQANALRLGLGERARFILADWRHGLAGRLLPERFGLIVSNPPYIPDGDIAGLEPEVSRFEPQAALAGGPDGLGAYRCLAPQLPGLLTRDGALVFEVGQGQAASVADLLSQAGLLVTGTRADLAGIERCVIACPHPR